MALPNNTATITNNTTTSSVIAKGHKGFTKLFFNRVNAGAVVKAQGSIDGTTYTDITTFNPEAVTPLVALSWTNAGTSALYTFKPHIFQEINFIRFVSASNITDPAGATITLL